MNKALDNPLSLPLRDRIRKLYDDTTQGWVHVWGDHLHHGYYGPRGDEPKDHVQAQADMVDTLIDWAGAPLDGNVHNILDAGCGVGGSARHLAERFGAVVEGITLSPVQRDLAIQLSEGRSDVRFSVADANHSGFDDNTFDIVWALESGEHMSDKYTFLKECTRVLRPGGRLILATWCHRPTPPELNTNEEALLEGISQSYQSSLTWVPIRHYEDLLAKLPFEAVRSADWSESVTPFWSAVIGSIFSLRGLKALIGGGRTMLSGASGGLKMRRGLSQKLVRYVVLSALKKEHS